MINIRFLKDCCGCDACFQCCPKQAISMYQDNEGFFYPKVDMQTCIDCGLCERVCPEINTLPEKKPVKVLGAKMKDKDIVYNSSSGGIFTYLSNKILDDGGVVFGARFNEQWDVVHDYTETKEELAFFRKSKYVQSRIGDAFKTAKMFLNQGRKVLFSGTPCQIKALKLFLSRDYENLLTVDVVCHGVPSPKVWKMYLESLLSEKKINKNDVISIDFRGKQNSWIKFSFSILYKKENEVLCFNQLHHDNIYMKVFLSNLILRPSCENCKAKCGQSNSDLTIADFWGVNVTNPDFYEDTGVSLILVNSRKGQTFIDSNELDTIETSFGNAVKYNGGINKNLIVNKNRKAYFKNLDKTNDFMLYTINFINKNCAPSFYSKIKFNLKRIYKHIVK